MLVKEKENSSPLMEGERRNKVSEGFTLEKYPFSNNIGFFREGDERANEECGYCIKVARLELGNILRTTLILIAIYLLLK
jgi:hypothetical protein